MISLSGEAPRGDSLEESSSWCSSSLPFWSTWPRPVGFRACSLAMTLLQSIVPFNDLVQT